MSSSVPAHSYYGQPPGDYSLSFVSGSRLASASGPYVGRGNKCSGNDDSCEGLRAKGTEFCMGHLRRIAKENGVSEVTEDAASEDESE
jgi:hypothetical protein